jgi:hypothetical protein
MPSKPMLNLLPKEGNQVASNDNEGIPKKLYVPAKAVARVSMDANSDQLLASRSLLIKKQSKPDANGINMSNNAIIFALLFYYR